MKNAAGLAGLLGMPAGPATEWSPNNYVATWPSISIRATKGRPVVVRWVNEFPNNHLFCPHPEAADWPCAIDRTGSYYSQTPWFLSPAFEGPHIGPLFRPGGPPSATSASSWSNDTYTYPMTNDEATIWFHDQTLGKTHHNVIAGPAGFFPVIDPSKHAPVNNGVCQAAPGQSCDYTWLDPLITRWQAPRPGRPRARRWRATRRGAGRRGRLSSCDVSLGEAWRTTARYGEPPGPSKPWSRYPLKICSEALVQSIIGLHQRPKTSTATAEAESSRLYMSGVAGAWRGSA